MYMGCCKVNHFYMGCSKVNHVHRFLGRSRSVHADIGRPYRWYATNIFVGRGNFQGFVEVWFSNLYGYPQILVKLFWLGGMGFPSRFLNLIKLQNINLCLMCIDDSSLILLFVLLYFLV
jgi:hypothetical protein